MKKLMIVPAVALGLIFSTATTAQETKIVEKETAVVTQQEMKQKEYKKIETTKLPEAVQTAVSRDFRGATINEAHVADDKTYKLVVTVDNQKRTLYADENGNWIKP